MEIVNLYTSKRIVGKHIKEKRLLRGYTQQELADMLAGDRQYISKIENGKVNLTLDYLDKIIAKLKCDPKDIFNLKSNDCIHK